jgi:hypothetical protein
VVGIRRRHVGLNKVFGFKFKEKSGNTYKLPKIISFLFFKNVFHKPAAVTNANPFPLAFIKGDRIHKSFFGFKLIRHGFSATFLRVLATEKETKKPVNGVQKNPKLPGLPYSNGLAFIKETPTNYPKINAVVRSLHVSVFIALSPGAKK